MTKCPTLALLFMAASMIAAAPSAARDCGNQGDHPRRTAIPVFYVTDRNDIGASTPVHWGNESDDRQHFGMVETSILRSCATLAADYPDWWAPYTAPLPHHWRDYFIVHQDRPFPDSAAMAAAITQALTDLPGASGRPRQIILYVHGFRNGFTDAAERAARLSFDLGFRGVPVIFSWPSQGSATRYTWDATRVQRSQPFIRDLIRAIIDDVRPDQLHIVAHSMGNRGAIAALQDLARERPDLAQRVTSLTLLAPDVDQTVFRRIALPDLPRLAGRVTLIATGRDRALSASNSVNGGVPLGTYRALPPFTAPGMVTIDTSGVGPSSAFEMHHADFETQASIMREIEAGIAGAPIASRHCLEEVASEGGAYYRLDPRRPSCPASGPYPAN